MENFISLSDYDASIHREILDSLVRKDSPSFDPNIIEVCEERAISEMTSYMNKTYDCQRIFSAREGERHQLILMFALDIAIYHLFCLHNPYKKGSIRDERYKRALEWLKGIAKGDVTIAGAPRLPEGEQTQNSPWQIKADTIRPTML